MCVRTCALLGIHSYLFASGRLFGLPQPWQQRLLLHGGARKDVGGRQGEEVQVVPRGGGWPLERGGEAGKGACVCDVELGGELGCWDSIYPTYWNVEARLANVHACALYQL